MKKILPCLILVLFLFTCKRSHNPTPPQENNKTYTVEFDISAGASGKLQTKALATNSVGDAISDAANKLFYYVYNSSGNLITQLVQDSTTSNFGQIADTFSPGTYNIVVVAYKITAQGVFVNPTAPKTYSPASFSSQGFDTFYKTFNLTVTNSAIIQSVNLNRVVGQLQVKLTDPIPASTKSIEVDVVSDNNISFSTGLPGTTISTLKILVPIAAGAVGTSNFTVTTYVANTTSPFNVNMIASNSLGGFAKATASNVTCQANTRTLLSGNLFTGGTGNFVITLDRSWDDNPITITF